jgi:hypothetical protein
MPDNTQNTQILLKRSDVSGARPTAADLALGEPAFNTADGKLFFKLSNGKIIDISESPIGNTYYVSMNGNDLLEGNTPNAAKRSIRAAMALANPGDTVVVSTGNYTETTPILIPQNVQVEGSGERACIVRPANTAQDIFWVNNNSYVTGFKFVNYSGSAISFPNVIDTNTAGTVTSNTIQLASGSTLVNNYYKGMTVRIDSGTGASFNYDQTRCYRDVGYMVDSISFDLLYGGNRQSVQSGVYYYNFNGNSTAVANQIPQVTTAYQHLKTISSQIILGQTVTPYQNVYSQNTSLSFGTTSEANTAQNLVNYILQIITTGPSAANTKTPISLNRSANTNVVNAATILQANRNFIASEVVAYTNVTYANTSFVYDQAKCIRDTKLLVDAIAQDLLFEGISQSTFAGLQYWNQNGYTGQIESQLALTVGAINYLNSLSQKIVVNNTTGTRYQSLVQQTFGRSGTSNESTLINNDFNTITTIINGGTTGVTDIIIPNSLTANTNSNVANSYNLLQANKSYLQAEVIAWVEANKFVNQANIISYNANTRVATIDAWNVLPDSGCQYSLRIPLRNTPAPADSKWSTHITGSPYIYNSSSITTLGGTGIKVDGNLAKGNKSIISAQFTQVNSNGVGIHILNDGYSQLVSIYGIFCDTAFLAESGGTASMGNCNVNFGNKGLVANGKGSLAMTGKTVNISQPSTKTLNINSIRVNTDLGVAAKEPYVGLIMKIDGEPEGTYYTISNSTLADETGNVVVTFTQNLANVQLHGTNVKFYQQSQLRASGQTFEWVGAGTDISIALPKRGGIANTQSQTIRINEGAVYATSTDQAGNFTVSDLTINQDTSTITGRTFSKSLFAEMTPYILALEG